MLEYFQTMFQLAINLQPQGLFFWFAVYFLLACLYSLVYQARIRRWKETAGILLSTNLVNSGGTAPVKSDQEYRLNAVYTYTVDGQTYQGTRVSPWVFMASHNLRRILNYQKRQIAHGSDGDVAVYYNPARPQKSFLVKPGIVGMIVTMLLGFTPALLYYSKWVAN